MRPTEHEAKAFHQSACAPQATHPRRIRASSSSRESLEEEKRRAVASRNSFEWPPFVVQGANGREGQFVARKRRRNDFRPPFVHPESRLAVPRAYPSMLVSPVGLEDGLCHPHPVRADPATPSAALEHVYALYRFARHLTGSGSDAEDLVQETYARALGARNQFVEGTNLRAWLFRILRNAYIDDYRRAQKGPVLRGLLGDDDGPDIAGASREVLRGDDELDRLRTVVARDGLHRVTRPPARSSSRHPVLGALSEPKIAGPWPSWPRAKSGYLFPV